MYYTYSGRALPRAICEIYGAIIGVKQLTRFLAIIENFWDRYVLIKWEVQLYDVKFRKCEIPELSTSGTITTKLASKMIVLPCKGKKFHIIKNNFSLHEVSIREELSNFFVGEMKITPFNGSVFRNGSRPFLSGS